MRGRCLTQEAVKAEGLTKSYGEVEALRGIDLTVPQGTVLGLLGPNGAGKTTAVRILTTLLPPDGGTASVAGLDVVKDAAALRSQIGLAGQYAAVDENLTGRENLDMVGRLYHLGGKESRTRADELLERFDLTDAGKRLVRTYSGGMRRRLDLAAALVARPPVIFLDEPTTGLDPLSRLGLWETIEDRVAGGTTVLLTTQYLDEADRLADSIAVIDHGLVIAEGTSDQLKDRIGGERLEVTLEDSAQAEAGATALASMSDERARGRGRHSAGGLPAAAGRDRRGGPPPGRGRRRRRGRGRAAADAGRRVHLPHRPRGRGGEGGGGRVTQALADSLVIARRNLLRIPRAPDLLLSFTVQPVMFVLLFAYVFGGAIETPGFDDYKDFLMPGIITQSIAFGGFITAIGLSEDLNKGLIDRFRSLPMARSAVLAGRTAADVVTNAVSLTIMVAVGLIIGFDFKTGVPQVLAGVVLLLFFGYVFSWIFAFFGLKSSSPESAQSLGFITVFPLTFISSAFVPTDSMPEALQTFADVNPFTVVVNAMRHLWLDTPAGNSVWGALAWSVGLLAVFAPLAVRTYRRAAVK